MYSTVHTPSPQVLSDNPPPGQNDASCAHLVRAGLDEGVDAKGTPFVERECEDSADNPIHRIELKEYCCTTVG